MTVVLIRHGETEWSRTGRHTGTTDIPLTDEGWDQARALAPLVAARRFAVVLVSPLQRARQTAEAAGLVGGVIDPDLTEWDYGVYDGLTFDEVRAQNPDWVLWRDGCPGGEGPDDVARRADRVVARAQAVDGDVALVAHGHILRVLAARWLGTETAAGRFYKLSTASISELGRERDQPTIQSWNLSPSR